MARQSRFAGGSARALRSFGAAVLLTLLQCAVALSDSEFELGMRALDLQQYEKAAEYLRKAADAGDTNAQFQIAMMYDVGLGVPKSSLQAHEYYSLSAAQGSLRAERAVEALEARLGPERLASARERSRQALASRRAESDGTETSSTGVLSSLSLAHGGSLSDVSTLEPSYRTRELVLEVLRVASMSSRTITVYDVDSPRDCPNACAGVRPKRLPGGSGVERLILMNRSFFVSGIQDVAEAYTVLAHELGHHANFHNLSDPDYENSRPEESQARELEADEFAGNIAQRLGLTQEQAQSWFRRNVDEHGSRTHPNRARRLAAIKKGWDQAASIRSSEGRIPEQPPSEESEQPPIRQPDEPPMPPQPMPGNVCVTFAGACLLPVAGPAGHPCYCATPFGPVWGSVRSAG